MLKRNPNVFERVRERIANPGVQHITTLRYQLGKPAYYVHLTPVERIELIRLCNERLGSKGERIVKNRVSKHDIVLESVRKKYGLPEIKPRGNVFRVFKTIASDIERCEKALDLGRYLVEAQWEMFDPSEKQWLVKFYQLKMSGFRVDQRERAFNQFILNQKPEMFAQKVPLWRKIFLLR